MFVVHPRVTSRMFAPKRRSSCHFPPLSGCRCCMRNAEHWTGLLSEIQLKGCPEKSPSYPQESLLCWFHSIGGIKVALVTRTAKYFSRKKTTRDSYTTPTARLMVGTSSKMLQGHCVNVHDILVDVTETESHLFLKCTTCCCIAEYGPGLLAACELRISLCAMVTQGMRLRCKTICRYLVSSSTNYF